MEGLAKVVVGEKLQVHSNDGAVLGDCLDRSYGGVHIGKSGGSGVDSSVGGRKTCGGSCGGVKENSSGEFEIESGGNHGKTGWFDGGGVGCCGSDNCGFVE
ncbi:Hypothetical predicted protein [Olea europaea subsp. europaea]|uniref:Uncharacterized protein n=1 Tax=Olea europaea subsp. europaea TaxID=158383 RepID=A0A8S0SSB8_OLEEU|nr:Hypothetical predicted protein [Olea europaea subsp. europaea]